MLAIFTAMLIVLVPFAAALAENPLGDMFEAAEKLLFDTGNVTVKAHAEFSLDGERFKTADGTYVQDGERSFWDLMLKTPKADGTEREGGYTVIADGEKVYVMETYYPGVYKTGTDAAQSTLVRRTVQLNVMAELAGFLVNQAAPLLGEDAVTVLPEETDGTAIRVKLGEDAPELVQMSLNLFYQYIAKRYFEMDYDHLNEENVYSLDNLITVTQGILYCTRSVSLKEADVMLARDGAGNLNRAEGTVSLLLNTSMDGAKALEISFTLETSAWGESRVKPFDPADYGVVLAEGAMDLDITAEEGVDAETENRMLEQIREVWKEAGYTLDDSMTGIVYRDDQYYYVNLFSQDDTVILNSFTDHDGKVLGLHDIVNLWQNVDDGYHFETYPDSETVKEVKERALAFIGLLNPELRQKISALQITWWYETGEELYFEMQEDPISQDGNGVLITVRVRPDWRIEFYSTVSQG